MTRLALIGLGNIGRVHLANLAGLRGVEIAAVFDSQHDLARRLASQYGVAVASSVDEICADASVDGVVVATPTESHLELASRVLAARKHLFLEKPLAGSLEDAKAIIVLAARHAGQKIQVGFCERYNPQFVELKRAVQQGVLGEPRCIQSSRTAPYALGNPDWELGVLDTAVHNIDLILWLFQQLPVRILAHGVQLYPSSAIPHSVTILMEFANGALATDTVTWLADVGHPLGQCARARMSVIGADGSAEVDLSHRPLSLLSAGAYREVDTVIIGGAGYAGCLAAQFDGFLASMAGTAPVVATVESAYDAERVVLAAHQSLTSSNWVRLP